MYRWEDSRVFHCSNSSTEDSLSMCWCNISAMIHDLYVIWIHWIQVFTSLVEKFRTIYMKRAWFYLLINPSGNTFPVTSSNDSSPQSPVLTLIWLHLHSGLSVQWARLKLFECRRSGLWNVIVLYCLHKCNSFANNTKC